VTIATSNGNITMGVGGSANLITISSAQGLAVGFRANTSTVFRQYFCGVESSPGSGVFSGGAYRGSDAGIQINGNASTFVEMTQYGSINMYENDGAGLYMDNGCVSVSGTLFASTSANIKRTLQTTANNATGTPGEIRWDANYIYVCTATNTWKRATLNTY
jgi:hypothetical protein